MGDLLGRLGLDPASSPQRGFVAAGYGRQLNIARDTVAGALTSEGPPKYRRERCPGDRRHGATDSGVVVGISADAGDSDRRAGGVDGFDLVVSGAGPGDPPGVLPADPVDRLQHPPGRVIQCDLWFPRQDSGRVRSGVDAAGAGDGGRVLPIIAAVMLPSRQTMDLVAGMSQLLSQGFSAVPHELWWDNEAGIGRRGRLTDPVTALMGTLVRAGATQTL